MHPDEEKGSNITNVKFNYNKKRSGTAVFFVWLYKRKSQMVTSQR